VLSVRDDGVGIVPGRLAAAEAEGRMGVAQSIRGRVAELGGVAELDTAPGLGTEWEVRLPRPGPGRRTGG
jgi:signal transduction histidine kinase